MFSKKASLDRVDEIMRLRWESDPVPDSLLHCLYAGSILSPMREVRWLDRASARIVLFGLVRYSDIHVSWKRGGVNALQCALKDFADVFDISNKKPLSGF